MKKNKNIRREVKKALIGKIVNSENKSDKAKEDMAKWLKDHLVVM